MDEDSSKVTTTILETLLDIQKTVNKASTDITVMKTDLTTVSKTVTEHRDILFGDPKTRGKDGLVAVVQKSEETLVKHEEVLYGNGEEGIVPIVRNFKAETKGMFRTISWIAIIVTAVFNGAVLAVRTFFHKGQ